MCNRWVLTAHLILVGQVGWALDAAEIPAKAAADAAAELCLVPWPKGLSQNPGRRPSEPVASDRSGIGSKSVDRTDHRLTLGAEARIVASGNSLAPLAHVVAGEIQTLFGRKLPVVETAQSRPGDIALTIDPALAGEHYRLEATDRVRVSGGGYAGVAAGTVTLLQALKAEGATLVLPVMRIVDAPAASYRGLMLDPARCWHSPEMLRQCIVLCRWYKIRFLQLHLTDNESFTFPSQAYPQLPTPGRHYTTEQLRQLDQYAVERGVVIVPECEMPGHSWACVQAMPKLFAAPGGRRPNVNFAKAEVCQALDTMIGEMLDVFRATPYFHIGADECDLTGLDQNPDFQAAMTKAGLPSVEELYRKFLVERNQTVKRHGKQMIVWEGFRPGGKVDIPRDILVMAFEGGKYYRPDHLVRDGYTIINTSWQPIYVVTARRAPIGQWPVEHIFGWNMHRWEHFRQWAPAYDPIQLPADAPVLGAQMCSWANPEEKVIPFVRERLAAMSERIWNPAAGRDFQDFARRLRATDVGLTALLAGK